MHSVAILPYPFIGNKIGYAILTKSTFMPLMVVISICSPSFSIEFLHPNLKEITIRPWGAKEFGLRDNQLGIIIKEW